MYMQKPGVTEEQKQKFKQEFQNIWSEVSQDVQSKWNGEIIWNPITDEPMFERNISGKLHGKLADRYVILLNKLNDRRI